MEMQSTIIRLERTFGKAAKAVCTHLYQGTDLLNNAATGASGLDEG